MTSTLIHFFYDQWNYRIILKNDIFSRMGVSRSVSITKTEFQRENLEFKINDMAALGNFEIFDLLEEYKNCSEQMVALEQQSYLFFKTMAEDFFKHTSEKALKNYEEALKLCIKNYELGMIPKSRKAKT